MASYRRYVARHPLALARALRQVRLHEWETYGKVQRSGRWAVLECPLTMAPTQSFQDYVRSLAGSTMTVDVNPPAEFFDSLAELGRTLSSVRIPAPAFGPMDPDHVDQALKGMTGRGLFTQPDLPVIAYRSKLGGSRWCTDCATPSVIRFGTPLTSEDLPDGGLCLKCERDLLIVVSPPSKHKWPVIAYRGRRSGVLRCSECTGSFLLTDELTSDDLPDGGLCSVCDRDLLIVSGVHCSICKHAPHGGEAGCHCGCRGQR